MNARMTLAAMGLLLGCSLGGAERPIKFNGRRLDAQQMKRLEILEAFYRVRLLDRDYFYDNRSGAVGFWGGPVVAALPAGLDLGGPMPENASAGDTGVFVNGRELHRLDVLALSQFVSVLRGRYWVDAYGNVGFEGGPMLGNLFLAAQQSGGNSGQHRVYSAGEIAGITINEAGACTSSGCVYR